MGQTPARACLEVIQDLVIFMRCMEKTSADKAAAFLRCLSACGNVVSNNSMSVGAVWEARFENRPFGSADTFTDHFAHRGRCDGRRRPCWGEVPSK